MTSTTDSRFRLPCIVLSRRLVGPVRWHFRCFSIGPQVRNSRATYKATPHDEDGDFRASLQVALSKINDLRRERLPSPWCRLHAGLPSYLTCRKPFDCIGNPRGTVFCSLRARTLQMPPKSSPTPQGPVSYAWLLASPPIIVFFVFRFSCRRNDTANVSSDFVPFTFRRCALLTIDTLTPESQKVCFFNPRIATDTSSD